MKMVNEYECELLGLDIKKVKKLEQDLKRISKKAGKMGLHIFGGSGSTLRCGSIIVAGDIGTDYDGGDGGTEFYRDVEIGETEGHDTEELQRFIDKLIERHKEKMDQEMEE